MTVTLIFNNAVYILDDFGMLPASAQFDWTRSALSRDNSSTEAANPKGVSMSLENSEEVLEETATQPTMSSPDSKLRVLFVEDNDYIRDLTVCLLEGADREVVCFASAEEAYEEFKKRPYDVVITDVSLPKMSGVDLTKKLVAIAPDTWFVIASGYQLPPGIEKIGPRVRVMTKPFETDKIEVIFKEMASSR